MSQPRAPGTVRPHCSCAAGKGQAVCSQWKMPRRPGAGGARPPHRRRPGETGAGRESAVLRREAGGWTIDGSGRSVAVGVGLVMQFPADEFGHHPLMPALTGTRYAQLIIHSPYERQPRNAGRCERDPALLAICVAASADAHQAISPRRGSRRCRNASSPSSSRLRAATSTSVAARMPRLARLGETNRVRAAESQVSPAVANVGLKSLSINLRSLRSVPDWAVCGRTRMPPMPQSLVGCVRSLVLACTATTGEVRAERLKIERRKLHPLPRPYGGRSVRQVHVPKCPSLSLVSASSVAL